MLYYIQDTTLRQENDMATPPRRNTAQITLDQNSVGEYIRKLLSRLFKRTIQQGENKARGFIRELTAGCSKRSSNEAAGKSQPKAYPQGYVEDCDEPRTKLGAFFSSRC